MEPVVAAATTTKRVCVSAPDPPSPSPFAESATADADRDQTSARQGRDKATFSGTVATAAACLLSRLPTVLAAHCCGFLSLTDRGAFARLDRAFRRAADRPEAQPYRVDMDVRYRPTNIYFYVPTRLLRVSPRALTLRAANVALPWEYRQSDRVPPPADWAARIHELRASRGAWNALEFCICLAFSGLRHLTIVRDPGPCLVSASSVFASQSPVYRLVPRKFPRAGAVAQFAALRSLAVQGEVPHELYTALPLDIEHLSVLRECTSRRRGRFLASAAADKRAFAADRRARQLRESRIALMNRPWPRLGRLRVPLDFSDADLCHLYGRAPVLQYLHVRRVTCDSTASSATAATTTTTCESAATPGGGALSRHLVRFAYDTEVLVGGRQKGDDDDVDGYGPRNATRDPTVVAVARSVSRLVVVAAASAAVPGADRSDPSGASAAAVSITTTPHLGSFRFGARLRPAEVAPIGDFLARLHTLRLANTTCTPTLLAIFGTRERPRLPQLRRLGFRPSYRSDGTRYNAARLDLRLVFALPALEELDLRFCRLLERKHTHIDDDDTDDTGANRWRCDLEDHPAAAAAACRRESRESGKDCDGDDDDDDEKGDPKALLVLPSLRVLDLRSCRLFSRRSVGGSPRLLPVGAVFPGLAQLRVRADHAFGNRGGGGGDGGGGGGGETESSESGGEVGVEVADRLMLVECQHLARLRVQLQTQAPPPPPIGLPNAHMRQFSAIPSHPTLELETRLPLHRRVCAL